MRGDAIWVDIKPKSKRLSSTRPRHCSRMACAVCACVALLQVYSLAYYEAALTAAADQRPPLLLRGASTSGGAGEAAGAASEGEEAALFGAGDAGDALSELGYRGGVSIPKVFHQSWRDDGFPKDLFNWRWQAGLVRLNPEWRLMRWTDNSSRALIASEYPWFLAHYDAYPSYIQRSDAARYFIVHRHGGVYLDLDYECSRPFGPVLAGARAAFSYKSGTNASLGLANAIFASEAGHPVWEAVFRLLVARASEGAAAESHVDVIRSTGPGLLRSALEELREGGRLEELGVRLLPSPVWHPLRPEQKRGRDATEATRRLLAASYCVHHFVSSWVVHDRERHSETDTARREGAAAEQRGVVPVGQALREANRWRSYVEPRSDGSHDAATRRTGRRTATGS